MLIAFFGPWAAGGIDHATTIKYRETADWTRTFLRLPLFKPQRGSTVNQSREVRFGEGTRRHSRRQLRQAIQVLELEGGGVRGGVL